MKKQEVTVHSLLSDLTDFDANIYEMARTLARIAKHIKEDTKEEAEPPKPVLQAIKVYHASKV
jgi:DNA-directed RNA polymerase subunit K/omega